MKQTPIREYFNSAVLALVPSGASRIVEVGCASGRLAHEYRKSNPDCEYIGVEINADYAEVARPRCTSIVVGNIEEMDDETFGSLFPASCWIFGDVLEHLYDPWSVLRRIRGSLDMGSSVVACIPNAQHWSVQTRLNSGAFRYEDLGLLDRTHIRWFTKTTLTELFHSSGFSIVEGGGVELEEKDRERALLGVRALATAMGNDADEAATNATAYQWIVRAMPVA